MKNTSSRLEQWMKQGNVTISQLFFTHYRALELSDQEAMVILHIQSYQQAGIHFPTPTEISSRMEITEHQVAAILQRLMQRGLLFIEQSNTDKMVEESYVLYQLWERLVDCLEKEHSASEKKTSEQQIGELFRTFEEEFGRVFTPLEYETISKWIDEDRHSVDVIRQALVEAVLAEKKSLKYIDRILFEWKKKNLTTLEEIRKHSEGFHKYTVKRTPSSESRPKVPFYNWLEERE
ncbi:DNA replication protein [Chryseomicrobium aureum]|uniref:DnaD domain-containing protein n=1 Tax=Chryseomicrobium aureum TaxID=1441723 RepID=UPI003084194C|nr:DNA replication protein [Chryseomicrobium aureum]